jgi:hypothetical protein
MNRLTRSRRIAHAGFLVFLTTVICQSSLAQGGYFFDANPLPPTIEGSTLRLGGIVSVRSEPCTEADAALELVVWAFSGPYWPGVFAPQGYDILTVPMPKPSQTSSGACVSELKSSTAYSLSNPISGTNYLVYFLRAQPSASCHEAPDCYESFFSAGTYNSQQPPSSPQYRSAPKLPAYHATLKAVEYYHAGFNHYFLTTLGPEIALLDNGYFPGWARTDETFDTYANGWSTVRGAMCRFFSDSFAPKSSHFFTTDANECGLVKANPNWTYEAVTGYLTLPNYLSQCPLEGVPLYRLYNNGMGGAPNHRYTTSLTIRAEMIAKGWVSEGYGPLGAIGCAFI